MYKNHANIPKRPIVKQAVNSKYNTNQKSLHILPYIGLHLYSIYRLLLVYINMHTEHQYISTHTCLYFTSHRLTPILP